MPVPPESLARVPDQLLGTIGVGGNSLKRLRTDHDCEKCGAKECQSKGMERETALAGFHAWTSFVWLVESEGVRTQIGSLKADL